MKQLPVKKQMSIKGTRYKFRVLKNCFISQKTTKNTHTKNKFEPLDNFNNSKYMIP